MCCLNAYAALADPRPRGVGISVQEDARRKDNKRKHSASDAAPSAGYVAREVATGHMKPLGREQVAAEHAAQAAARRDTWHQRQQERQQQHQHRGDGHTDGGMRRAPLYACTTVGVICGRT